MTSNIDRAENEPRTTSQVQQPRRAITHAYKRYVLGMATLMLTMNYIDRGLVVLLLEPIKGDLHLSDTQLGFLTGGTFALFYAGISVPVARLADRGNRVTLAAAALILWGISVMSCQLVTTFMQLALLRIGAAIGEAGTMPPTYSLVGDYFVPPAERARAMAVYCLGSPLSQLISFAAGSLLNARFGWRMTFLIMGIPAVIVAILSRLTVREIRQLRAPPVSEPSVPSRQPRVFKVLVQLWDCRPARHLTLAVVVIYTLSLGLYPWYAAFMIRSHAMSIAEVGIWFGCIFGVGGSVGVFSGGYLLARYLPDDDRAQMRTIAVLTALLTPLFALFLLLPERYQALAALIPLLIAFNLFLAPTYALFQRLMPENMRATALALVMLLANLVGMGLGPQLVGVVSDLLSKALGSDSLRYAMLAVSSLAIWAAYHFWQVGKELAKVDEVGGRTYRAQSFR